MTLRDLLQAVIDLGGSDLHLSAGSCPRVRVDGLLRAIGSTELTAADTQRLAYSALSDAQQTQFESAREIDYSFHVAGLARFRGSLFQQRGGVAAAYRAIPAAVGSFDELGLPAAVGALAERPRGLVLVTGPTGSGKSTTLAALLDTINSSRRAHILTIEDPIEFLHPHKGCLVNQREVHTDARSFPAALRAALRADPDIVLIGELRDRETIESALRIAETGHLTFGTLHTNSAAQTINRIIDVFPAFQQPQIRTQLSFVLEAVVCQSLVPRASGRGRVPALEILVATPAIRTLIRDGKVHQVYSAMQTGQEKGGMQTLNQSLAALCRNGVIRPAAALAVSGGKEELRELLSRRQAGQQIEAFRALDSGS